MPRQTILDQIHAREAAAEDFLSTVSRMEDSAAKENVLRAAAGREHAAHPQYRGKWDNHKLCQVTREIKTKMGVAFKKGDFALFAPMGISREFPNEVSVYSHRTGCDTVIRPSYIKPV